MAWRRGDREWVRVGGRWALGVDGAADDSGGAARRVLWVREGEGDDATWVALEAGDLPAPPPAVDEV